MPSMTLEELMQDDGMTREQAEREMRTRVFGNPEGEERGIGSPWSVKHHPELNRNHFAAILSKEGDEAYARALKAAGLKQAP